MGNWISLNCMPIEYFKLNNTTVHLQYFDFLILPRKTEVTKVGVERSLWLLNTFENDIKFSNSND
jgi:hypothetical protein